MYRRRVIHSLIPAATLASLIFCGPLEAGPLKWARKVSRADAPNLKSRVGGSSGRTPQITAPGLVALSDGGFGHVAETFARARDRLGTTQLYAGHLDGEDYGAIRKPDSVQTVLLEGDPVSSLLQDFAAGRTHLFLQSRFLTRENVLAALARPGTRVSLAGVTDNPLPVRLRGPSRDNFIEYKPSLYVQPSDALPSKSLYLLFRQRHEVKRIRIHSLFDAQTNARIQRDLQGIGGEIQLEPLSEKTLAGDYEFGEHTLHLFAGSTKGDAFLTQGIEGFVRDRIATKELFARLQEVDAPTALFGVPGSGRAAIQGGLDARRLAALAKSLEGEDAGRIVDLFAALGTKNRPVVIRSFESDGDRATAKSRIEFEYDGPGLGDIPVVAYSNPGERISFGDVLGLGFLALLGGLILQRLYRDKRAAAAQEREVSQSADAVSRQDRPDKSG